MCLLVCSSAPRLDCAIKRSCCCSCRDASDCKSPSFSFPLALLAHLVRLVSFLLLPFHPPHNKTVLLMYQNFKLLKSCCLQCCDSSCSSSSPPLQLRVSRENDEWPKHIKPQNHLLHPEFLAFMEFPGTVGRRQAKTVEANFPPCANSGASLFCYRSQCPVTKKPDCCCSRSLSI